MRLLASAACLLAALAAVALPRPPAAPVVPAMCLVRGQEARGPAGLGWRVAALDDGEEWVVAMEESGGVWEVDALNCVATGPGQFDGPFAGYDRGGLFAYAKTLHRLQRRNEEENDTSTLGAPILPPVKEGSSTRRRVFDDAKYGTLVYSLASSTSAAVDGGIRLVLEQRDVSVILPLEYAKVYSISISSGNAMVVAVAGVARSSNEVGVYVFRRRSPTQWNQSQVIPLGPLSLDQDIRILTSLSEFGTTLAVTWNSAVRVYSTAPAASASAPLHHAYFDYNDILFCAESDFLFPENHNADLRASVLDLHLSRDATVLLFSPPSARRICVFYKSGSMGNWHHLLSLEASGAASLALSRSNAFAFVGSPYAENGRGSVSVFQLPTFVSVKARALAAPTLPVTPRPSNFPSHSPTASMVKGWEPTSVLVASFPPAFEWIRCEEEYEGANSSLCLNQGSCVGLSQDGKYIVVGAPANKGGKGSAFYYKSTNFGNGSYSTPNFLASNNWVDGQSLFFGKACALSQLGNLSVIADERGFYLFNGPFASLQNSPEAFVDSKTGAIASNVIALSGDGSTLVYCSPSNSSLVLVSTAQVQTPQAVLTISLSPQQTITQMYSAALNVDGTVCLVGVQLGGKYQGQCATFLFTKTGKNWAASFLLGIYPDAPLSVALSASGRIAAVGVPGDNWAIIYGHSGASNWLISYTTPQLSLTPIGSVALSNDGRTFAVGYPQSNHVAIYTRNRDPNTWVPSGTLAVPSCSSCSFGASISMSANGSVILVGAPNQNNQIGAAWVFYLLPSTHAPTESPSSSPIQVYPSQAPSLSPLPPSESTAPTFDPTSKPSASPSRQLSTHRPSIVTSSPHSPNVKTALPSMSPTHSNSPSSSSSSSPPVVAIVVPVAIFLVLVLFACVMFLWVRSNKQVIMAVEEEPASGYDPAYFPPQAELPAKFVTQPPTLPPPAVLSSFKSSVSRHSVPTGGSSGVMMSTV